MSTDFDFRSGDRAAPASLAAVPLLLGCCRDGVVGDSYTFDPGADVLADLGPGKAYALALAMGAIGRCVVSPVAPSYPTLPSVTPTGGGPVVSLAALGGGALDDAKLLLTVTTSGDLGAARVDLCYDGATVAESFTVPPALPAVLRGAVDITPAVLAQLAGLTLVATAPASKTLTLPAGSLAADGVGLKVATATVTAPVTLTQADLLAAGIAATHANVRRLRFTTSGTTPGDAPASVTITAPGYDGTSQTETVSLAQTATSVSSAKAFDVTTCSLAYPAAEGTGAFVAIGYEDAYSSADELVTELNVLAAAAPLAIAARAYEDATGAIYLELYTTAAGASAALAIDATSTGDTVLGLSNTAAAGAASTKVLTPLGLVATFAAGAYPLAGTYSAAVKGPRGAVADYTAALQAAIDNYQAHPFGYVGIVEDPATNTSARGVYDALRLLAATYQHDPDSPCLFDVVSPTALHVASIVKATNDAALSAWETSLLTAFAGASVSLESVAVDDVYVPGPPLMPGLHRRPATWAAVLKRSSLDRLAGNPADGLCPLVSLAGADGTRARDEAKRSTKLAGLGGAGFWALKSTQDGGVKFAPAATRAGSLDRYRSPGAVAFALEASRAIIPALQEYEGTWETDPGNPTAADPAQLDHRRGELEALIGPIASPTTPGAKKNVANFSVTVTAPNVLNDGVVNVLLDFNPMAVAEKTFATITATGVALNTGA